LIGRFRRLLRLWGDLQALDERVSELDREITMIARRIRLPNGSGSYEALGRSLARH